MVLGTPTTGRPLRNSSRAIFMRAVAADRDEGVDAQLGGVRDHVGGDVANDFLAVLFGVVAEGIAAVGGAEDGAAAGQDAADVFRVSWREPFGQIRPSKPSRMPMTFHWYLRMADLTTARMTALSPGASPPPVQMPMVWMVIGFSRRSSVVSRQPEPPVPYIVCHSE